MVSRTFSVQGRYFQNIYRYHFCNISVSASVWLTSTGLFLQSHPHLIFVLRFIDLVPAAFEGCRQNCYQPGADQYLTASRYITRDKYQNQSTVCSVDKFQVRDCPHGFLRVQYYGRYQDSVQGPPPGTVPRAVQGQYQVVSRDNSRGSRWTAAGLLPGPASEDNIIGRSRDSATWTTFGACFWAHYQGMSRDNTLTSPETVPRLPRGFASGHCSRYSLGIVPFILQRLPPEANTR